MKKTVILSLLMLCSVLAFAQQADTLRTFSIQASLWSRGEFRDGALPAENGVDHAGFLMSNNVIRMNYSGKNLEARFSPMFFGIWGAKGSGSLAIEEAWLGLKSGGWFMRLGRQKLSYDDERIIGGNDWAMATSTHDIIKAGFELGKHKLHVLAAFNQNNENTNGGSYYKDGAQAYKNMQALWYHFDPVPQLGASLIFMNTGMQNTMLTEKENKTEYQQLFGAFVSWKPRYFSLQASYYRQTGHDEYGLPIHAWMTGAEVEWRIADWLGLNPGFFFMSGDQNYFVPQQGAFGMARKTEVRGFNPIFGSHHQFYGAMDFFYVNTYYGGNTPGLQDYHAGLRLRPFQALNLDVSYHLLATAVPIENASTQVLGHEVELEASWKIGKDITLMAGYSFMVGTETMQLLKRGDEDRLRWAWLMLRVTPEFLNHKW